MGLQPRSRACCERCVFACRSHILCCQFDEGVRGRVVSAAHCCRHCLSHAHLAQGKRISERGRSKLRESEDDFLAKITAHPPVRLPGTAAFLSSATRGIPLTLTHHLRHIYALHERVLLVTVMTSEEPRVTDEARVHIHELCAGLTRVILHFGFAGEVRQFPKACVMRRSRQSFAAGSTRSLLLHRPGNGDPHRAHSGHVGLARSALCFHAAQR